MKIIDKILLSLLLLGVFIHLVFGNIIQALFLAVLIFFLVRNVKKER